MAKHPTILEQFRSFCFQNKPQELEQAIEYFSVFGGMSWSVDMTKSLEELIESKVLKNYTYIHGDITKITQSDKVSHSLLSAVAMGDGRVHSALKRARISRNEGENAIDTLCGKNIIKTEFPLESPPDSDEKVDEKLNFNTPFMRFWFAFVSPYFKTIKEGDFKEVKEQFNNRKSEFYELTFKKLSMELMKKSFKDDPIVEIGSYWDRNTQIDILAKTASGKIIAGICKYSNSKAKKSELTRLKEQCDAAELT
ncbi:MAG: ATPase, partial [Sulfuricurvum sp. RIFCSPLOWO2_12_43_5]